MPNRDTAQVWAHRISQATATGQQQGLTASRMAVTVRLLAAMGDDMPALSLHTDWSRLHEETLTRVETLLRMCRGPEE